MGKFEFNRADIVPTSDGSSTLVHSHLGELYHSRHGAWTESQHIFIRHGLSGFLEEKSDGIRVFEMGFGSGLNAALTREEAERHQVRVFYTAMELFPIEESVVAAMIMPEQNAMERERWLELHRTPWNEATEISPYFTLHKIHAAFPDVPDSDPGGYHLIYFDAFAPAAQPELWSVNALTTCYQLLVPGGRWLSYCAKGQVRRNLREAGFEVEALPGPPGKREITRAVK